jgi:bifunctional enzyme CysN/CysC
LFPENAFAEVWVKTPAEVCSARDPKGLYKKAASGELPNLTGVGQEYEAPVASDLVLDGTEEVESSASRLLSKLFPEIS